MRAAGRTILWRQMETSHVVIAKPTHSHLKQYPFTTVPKCQSVCIFTWNLAVSFKIRWQEGKWQRGKTVCWSSVHAHGSEVTWHKSLRTQRSPGGLRIYEKWFEYFLPTNKINIILKINVIIKILYPRYDYNLSLIGTPVNECSKGGLLREHDFWLMDYLGSKHTKSPHS